MKFLLKIFTIFSSIFFLSGCFAKYETPPIAKKVDLQKKGVVAEFDMSVTEEEIYTFFLKYGYDGEQYDKELAELKKQYPNTHSSKLPRTNTWKTFSKIVGIYDENFKEIKGSKIVLKVTLTPMFDIEKEYLAFESYRSDGKITYTNGKRVITVSNPPKPPIEKIIDLSEIKVHHSSGDGTKSKSIYSIWLPKGDYHIKLENLEDVPEINQIKTTFSIYFYNSKV